MNPKVKPFIIVIIVLVVVIFIYNKYIKKYENPLTVVKNSLVSTKLSAKTRYKFNAHTDNLGLYYKADTTVLPILPTTGAKTEDYTGKEFPDTSGLETGLPGNYTINIYNVGPDSFSILGISLKTLTSGSPKTTILKNMGPRKGDREKYDGNAVNMSKESVIRYSELTDYVVNRLTIICNNVIPRSLFIYLQAGASDSDYGVYYGALFKELTKDILVIDFFK